MKKIIFTLSIILLGAGCQTSKSPEIKHPYTPSKEENITIQSPIANTAVSLPFTIKGEARVFENNLMIEIRDYEGNTLFKSVVTAQSPDIGKFGPYEKTIDFLFKESKTQNLILEAFNYSAKDGEKENIFSIPITLKEQELRKVIVHFNKLEQNNCQATKPKERYLVPTQTPARKTIEALLLGPSPEEIKSGFITSLNQFTKINKLTIENGIAKIDFNEGLDVNSGGSCHAQAVRAQIENTLKEFPSVANVIISINGDSETILQP